MKKYHKLRNRQKITREFQIEKNNKFQIEKEKIPTRIILIRKRKLFQLEKGKYSNKKKENIPINKRKIFLI